MNKLRHSFYCPRRCPRCAMRRLFLVFIFALGLIAPASALELLSLPITTATGPAVSQTFQIRPGPGGQWLPATMTVQGTFTWGSGGTSTDAYLQTSIDGGTTWTDVAEFHFLAASARFIWTLESSLIAAPVQVTAPTDGAMTANTALSGVFGNLWRVKYVTVGTYAGRHHVAH